jgi:hypothetical protein
MLLHRLADVTSRRTGEEPKRGRASTVARSGILGDTALKNALDVSNAMFDALL